MTAETALLIMSSALIANAVAQDFLLGAILMGVDDLRGKRINHEARQTGERHVIRPGGTPDVRIINDRGERVRPSQPL